MQQFSSAENPLYILRFPRIFSSGSLAFPCDAAGTVCLDNLPEKARENYQYARCMLGKEFLMPRVEHADQ